MGVLPSARAGCKRGTRRVPVASLLRPEGRPPTNTSDLGQANHAALAWGQVPLCWDRRGGALPSARAGCKRGTRRVPVASPLRPVGRPPTSTSLRPVGRPPTSTSGLGSGFPCCIGLGAGPTMLGPAPREAGAYRPPTAPRPWERCPQRERGAIGALGGCRWPTRIGLRAGLPRGTSHRPGDRPPTSTSHRPEGRSPTRHFESAWGQASCEVLWAWGQASHAASAWGPAHGSVYGRRFRPTTGFSPTAYLIHSPAHPLTPLFHVYFTS